MPGIQKQDHVNYSRFDKMSTEELEEILFQDSLLSESEESDMDAILYIMEVVSRRTKEDPARTVPDVDEALASFQKNYAPLVDSGKSLYDFDNSNPEDKKASDKMSFKPNFSFRKNRNPRLLHKASLIAAMFVCVLLIGSVTVQALGFNLWGAVAKWTSDIFGYTTSESLPLRDSQKTVVIPVQLGELHAQLLDNAVIFSVLPSQIPDGYEAINTTTDTKPEYTDFYCILKNEQTNETLVFQYRLHKTDSDLLVYEKNEGALDIYSQDGIEYCLSKNMDKYRVVWSIDNLECSITGFQSREETIKVINSIGE